MTNDFIRIATIDDVPAMQLILKTLKNPWNSAVLEDCFGRNYRQFVIERQKKIVGFVTIKISSEYWEIMFIAIDTHFQKKNLATKLLKYVIEDAKIAKIKSLQLEVRKSNCAAIALYKTCGFTQVGVRKEYYFNGDKREDALLFDYLI